MEHAPIIINMSPWSDSSAPRAPASVSINPPLPSYECNYEPYLEDFLNRVGIYLFLTLTLGIVTILEFILLK